MILTSDEHANYGHFEFIEVLADSNKSWEEATKKNSLMRF